MTERQMHSAMERIALGHRAAIAAELAGRSDALCYRMLYHWPLWRRRDQLPPGGAWRVWLVMAGRGFGKTRVGAEWVREAATSRRARIALVGATQDEVRRVMVEGDSGVLAVSPPGERPRWEPSIGRLTWKTGARAFTYSAEQPEALRGPQHSHGWCDEIGKWSRGEAAWDNLMFSLRVGERPRVVATTTPRPVALIRRLVAEEGVAVTRGRTAANRSALPPAFLQAMEASYGGTRLGRQELDGELIEEVAGALWTRALLDGCRRRDAPIAVRRVVVGVDPPASRGGDACGIVAVALGTDGIGHVLEDGSVAGASPEGWAAAVAACAARHGADRVVAEANNGGEMVASVLRAADAGLPVKLVHAAHGKVARAEPVAMLYAAGRVVHVGAFPALEDELCGLVSGGGYEGPGRSPDRADALVWALSELLLAGRGEARVRVA